MASRCCREGPGVGWRGGILLCAAHCNMFAVSHPKHVPFSARRSYCSQTGEFLRQASCAGLHGRTVTGSRAWAWWRARAGGRPQMGPHAPWKFVRNPNEPRKSCSERWVGWRGEVCIHGLQRIPLPLPSDSQHGCCSPQPRLLDKLLRNRSMTHK